MNQHDIILMEDFNTDSLRIIAKLVLSVKGIVGPVRVLMVTPSKTMSFDIDEV